MSQIDLNCDLGEGGNNDAAMMPLITSANIACGIHAGDVDTMRAAVNLAQQFGVAIGAHPSLNDRENFGRKEMNVTYREAHLYVVTQTKLLQIIARQCGTKVTHVKPHGALYNMAARDAELADAIAAAVKEVDPALILYGLANSCLLDAGRVHGLQVASEVFADRTYQPNRSLTPRTQPNAVIADETVAVDQVVRMLRDGVVRTTDGTDATIQADTICLHSDGANPVNFALKLNVKLKSEGVRLKALTSA
ncbi:MAG: 5-oxoprolinase subunit PxpA [Lacunisphaera sp.]